MKRPRIFKGPASRYAGAAETIVEFSDGRSGGLISLRRDAEDRLTLDVYGIDADVLVRVSKETR